MSAASIAAALAPRARVHPRAAREPASSCALALARVARAGPSSRSQPRFALGASPSSSTRRRARRALVAAAADADDGFAPNSLGTLGAAIELRSRLREVELERASSRGKRGDDGWEEIDGSYVRAPSGRAWGVVHFIGGAVLGSYPHIAYDAFLSRVSDDAGVVVVATPYDLGVDHGKISRECATKLNRAWAAFATREGYDLANTPVFAFGHSLGCKLHLVAACGDGEGDGDGESAAAKRAGHLFVAFNNATAADSVRLLEKFAKELVRKRAETATGGDASANAAFDGFMRNLPNLTAMAERAASAAGLDFTPSPAETLERAKRGFESPRATLLSFEEDDLDQNDELMEVLRHRYAMTTVSGDVPVSAVRLRGTHLTPVYFKLDGSKLSPAFGRLGGFSLGDEALVGELAAAGVKFLRG